MPVARLDDALPLMADVGAAADVPGRRARAPARGAADVAAPGQRRSGAVVQLAFPRLVFGADAPLRHGGDRHRRDAEGARPSTISAFHAAHYRRRTPRSSSPATSPPTPSCRCSSARSARGRRPARGPAVGGADAPQLTARQVYPDRQAGRRAVADPDRLGRRRRDRRPTTSRCACSTRFSAGRSRRA